MNVSRDDRQSLTEGFPARIRRWIGRTRTRLLGGPGPTGPSGNGSGDAAEGDASDRIATDGRGGNVRGSEKIMTPEEEVIEVVSANGGGMKQAEIVSSLEWSESTVSRKLSDLESKNAVTRYQIGREKLVYLPGAEPETLDSPFGRADTDRGSRA